MNEITTLTNSNSNHESLDTKLQTCGIADHDSSTDESMSESESEGTESAIKVASNWVTLSSIFRHLSLKDLVDFRTVNREWNQASCLTIGKKNLWTIKICDYCEFQPLQKSALECFQGCAKIPYTGLRLKLCFNADEREQNFLAEEAKVNEDKHNSDDADNRLFQFLKLHGSHIRSLSINIHHGLQMTKVCAALLSKLPHLETLQLKGTYTKTQSVEDVPDLHLNNIPVLRFLKSYSQEVECFYNNNSKHLLAFVLAMAPNLKEITKFNFRDVDAVIERTNKILTIKQLAIKLDQFTPTTCENAQALFKFAFSNPAPKLVSLEIVASAKGDSYEPDLCNAITNILSASQESLKNLNIPSSHRMVGIHFPPIFPNLETLEVGYAERRSVPDEGYDHDQDDNFGDDAEQIIPGANHARFLCPNVTQLALHVKDLRLVTVTQILHDYDYNPGSNMELQILSSLKKLTLQVENIHYYDEETVAKYFEIKFPNLTHVHFKNYDPSYRAFSKAMYHCLPSTVEYVELAGLDFVQRRFVLDAFFLGVSSQVCKEAHLQHCKSPKQQKKFIAGHKIFPGIVDLKNLKTLLVKFIDRSQSEIFTALEISEGTCVDREWQREIEASVITDLSGKHGFKMRPDLNVTFSYDQSCPDWFEASLKPVAPFIKISNESKMS